jgi:hypothetical protein
MAYMLKRFESEQKRVNDAVAGIGSDIGIIKNSIAGLNARVKRLEKHDRDDLKDRLAEATGSIDTNAQRAEAIAMAKQSTPRIPKEWLDKLPWVLSAALLGAALVGFTLAQRQVSPELTKDDIRQLILESKKEALMPPNPYAGQSLSATPSSSPTSSSSSASISPSSSSE